MLTYKKRIIRIYKYLFLATTTIIIFGCSYGTYVKPNSVPKNITNYKFSINIGNDPINAESIISNHLNSLGYIESDLSDCNNSIPQAGTSTGTGFYISKNGYIITNYHVIANASEIQITDNNKSIYIGKVINTDELNDLAILKTSPENHVSSYLNVYNNTRPQKGDQIYTLGFPLIDVLGESSRITQGIISSMYGINNDPRTYQITSPIQPGNSGGPLIDNKGNLIGVTVATINSSYIFKNSGTLPQNINFAIKISYVRPLIDMLADSAIINEQSNQLNIDNIENALVLIKANKGQKPSTQKNEICMIVYCSYNAYFDVFHHTLSSCTISYVNAMTNQKIASASFAGGSLGSAKTIICKLLNQLNSKLKRT